MKKLYLFNVYTFANLYVLLTSGPHLVYHGDSLYIHIYMIRCGWLGMCCRNVESFELCHMPCCRKNVESLELLHMTCDAGMRVESLESLHI